MSTAVSETAQKLKGTLLLTLTLGIASCGIGWGQDAWPKPPKSQKACVKPAFIWQDGKCYNNPNPCPDDALCGDGPAILEQSSKPLPECTSKLVDGVWVISDIPANGCKIHSECEGNGCHHKNPQSQWASKPDLSGDAEFICKIAKPKPATFSEAPFITTPMMTFTNSVTCDEQVAFRGRVKTLRELFPDECKPQTGAHQ